MIFFEKACLLIYIYITNLRSYINLHKITKEKLQYEFLIINHIRSILNKIFEYEKFKERIFCFWCPNKF